MPLGVVFLIPNGPYSRLTIEERKEGQNPGFLIFYARSQCANSLEVILTLCPQLEAGQESPGRLCDVFNIFFFSLEAGGFLSNFLGGGDVDLLWWCSRGRRCCRCRQGG